MWLRKGSPLSLYITWPLNHCDVTWRPWCLKLLASHMFGRYLVQLNDRKLNKAPHNWIFVRDSEHGSPDKGSVMSFHVMTTSRKNQNQDVATLLQFYENLQIVLWHECRTIVYFRLYKTYLNNTLLCEWLVIGLMVVLSWRIIRKYNV